MNSGIVLFLAAVICVTVGGVLLCTWAERSKKKIVDELNKAVDETIGKKKYRIEIVEDKPDVSWIVTDSYSGSQWAVLHPPHYGGPAVVLDLQTKRTRPTRLIKDPDGYTESISPNEVKEKP